MAAAAGTDAGPATAETMKCVHASALGGDFDQASLFARKSPLPFVAEIHPCNCCTAVPKNDTSESAGGLCTPRSSGLLCTLVIAFAFAI